MQELPFRETVLEELVEVHGIEWLAVFAYFDETGMHGDAAPITAVAGYLFSKDGAKSFRRKFDETIYPLLPPNENGEKTYRSAKCIPGRDQFSLLPEPEREHIVDLLVDAIKKSVVLGVCIAIKKEDYAKAIASSPKLRELAGDKYSVCLIRCAENMAAWLDREKIPGRVHYLFEAGCAYQNEANAILAKISVSNELKTRYRWHGYSFVDKGPDVPQLFAPDLLAWEWQRAYINANNPQQYTEWRLTLKRLADGTPFIPEMETETSVGIRALINVFYGLTLSGGADGGQAQ